MLYWPGVDKWPPSKEVVIAAVVMTFVIFPIALLLGIVGQVIFGGHRCRCDSPGNACPAQADECQG